MLFRSVSFCGTFLFKGWFLKQTGATHGKGWEDLDGYLAIAVSVFFLFIMACAAIAWIVQKQRSIALSTYEAEIMAGSLAACDIVFLRGILSELRSTQSGPTVLRMDNTGAIDLANDPMHHSKSKHIARRDLFLRELVERGQITTVAVKTSDMVADALTKPLEKSIFLKHRDTLLGATTP